MDFRAILKSPSWISHYDVKVLSQDSLGSCVLTALDRKPLKLPISF